ncbi:tetratricopeptide repeat protein [Methylophilaceae bacterium]|nr:tetratricopeptide repeat protein [Methylophilaceae bacterium]
MKILTLSEKRKQIAEAKKRKKAKSPSQEELIRLLEQYQTGQYDDAEKLAVYITQEFPYHHFGWKILGAILGQTSRISEAVNANQKSVELAPQDPETRYNLGIMLQKLGRLAEAEASYRQAIELKSDYALALNNLGITLKELGRLAEAEASYRQAIALKPDFAEPPYNLGITLQELGRLADAEASSRQAIALKPDYALAHNNLGITLKELGRLAEAEASYRQAIALKPDYAEAHSNLGVVLHMNGDIDSGLKSLEKANNIDPDLQNSHIILAMLKARKALGITEFSADNISNLSHSSEQFPQPVILNRAIEAELISSLYKMKSIELTKFDNNSISDPRFGIGKCSRDFKLFKDDSPTIKSVAEDLTIIMRKVVKSDIYISESFFNIFGAGGGSTPHKHLGKIDADEYLNFGKQKYSLVYYLSVGDQNCIDPGILKLYEPSEDILPYEGMIAIFPADRKHSSIYGGKKDRVMIGVNFYSLNC